MIIRETRICCLLPQRNKAAFFEKATLAVAVFSSDFWV
jgi:hypothetical protein